MGNAIKNKWVLLISVAGTGTFLDLYTKHLASTHLIEGMQVPIAGRFFSFLLCFNKAALFGLDPRHLIPWFPLNGFFYVFSSIAVVVLIAYYASIKKTDWPLYWGLALILPGAFGNLFDRALNVHRGVVDFLRLGVSDTLYWPIFNFADMYVTFGVAIILIGVLREGRKTEAPEKAVAGDQQKS